MAGGGGGGGGAGQVADVQFARGVLSFCKAEAIQGAATHSHTRMHTRKTARTVGAWRASSCPWPALGGLGTRLCCAAGCSRGRRRRVHAAEVHGMAHAGRRGPPLGVETARTLQAAARASSRSAMWSLSDYSDGHT
jgi:hypothetical protein